MQNGVVPIKPVSKDLLYMKIADAIHNYIHVNQLQEGDKIPSERVLAEQFKTGRNSVREALRVLENEGILQVKTGRGAFVSGKSSSDSIYLKLFKGNYLELLEIKMVLERSVILRAVERATDAQIAELESFLAELEREAAECRYARGADNSFHKKLLEMVENKTLEQMLTGLIWALDDYANMLEDADKFWLTTVPYHRQLLTAIQNRDPDAALRAYAKIEELDVYTLNTVMDSVSSREAAPGNPADQA